MAEKDKFDEFLEEVQTDIQHEKYRKLWETYGKQISTGVTVVLVAVCGYTFWSNQQVKEELRKSDYYLAAQRYIAEGKQSQALATLKEIDKKSLFSSAHGGAYGVFSKFTEAALLSEKGDKQNIPEAIRSYDSIANDTKLEPIWRQMATFQSILLQFEMDPSKSTELLARIEPLTKDGAPIQALALEQQAIMLQTSGRTADAREIFVKLVQMKNAPEGVLLRAQVMTQQMASEHHIESE